MALVENGVGKLAALRSYVKEIFQAMGNMHGGTHSDAHALSESLNVGLMIFSSDEQGEGRWLYSSLGSRADYPYWITLYCRSNMHFQLAELSAGGADDSATYVFNQADVPEPLAAHYNFCNTDNPFGSHETSGMN